MKTAEQRLNNIIGQLTGAKKMFSDSRRTCFTLLIQLKAARSAMSALMEKIVAEEFNDCLADSRPADKDKITKIFQEIIKK